MLSERNHGFRRSQRQHKEGQHSFKLEAFMLWFVYRLFLIFLIFF